MTNTTRGLGRGLGELFQRTEPVPRPTAAPPIDRVMTPAQLQAPTPDPGAQSSQTAVPPGVVPEGSYFAEIPLDQIRANPKQPRTVFDEDALAELVDSIREVGLLQPIVVRPLDDRDAAAPAGTTGERPDDAGPSGVRFELVMGERRWRASQLAGLEAIPTIVRKTEDHDLLRDALLENLHRTQLNPLEEAAAYQQMLEDFDCTQEELSNRIKRSRPQISNTIRLLRLPPTVQRRVAAGVLSAGHARALLAVPDALVQERLAQRVVAEGMSVRATEELVTLGETGSDRPVARRTRREPSDQARELADRLSDRLETRVKIDAGRTKGKITIEFASEGDLERIAGLLGSPRGEATAE